MRSCIYCGRDLQKDEKCTCFGAMNARRAKEAAENADKNQTSGWQENTYQTGYTKKKRKFSFKKPHFKKPRFTKPDFGREGREVKGFIKSFIYDPVNSVSGTGMLKPFQIFIIMILTALAVALCGYFIAARLIVGIYKIGFLIQYTLTGALSVFLFEAAFICVLYIINRFVLRRNIKLLTFASRPVFAFIPLMLFAFAGAAINFFSVYASIMLLLTGFVVNIILTYEAMRSEWSFISASRTLYLTGISYFIFFVVAFNCIKLF